MHSSASTCGQQALAVLEFGTPGRLEFFERRTLGRIITETQEWPGPEWPNE